MKKIELVLNSVIPSDNRFNLLLSEKNGTRRLLIVVGTAEGRVISWARDKIPILRPLTHDLILNILKEYGIELVEVVIDRLEDNIFSAHLVLKDENGIKLIDSRASDAIALALKHNVKIYITEEIFNLVSIDVMEFIEYQEKKKNPLEEKTLEELEEMLKEAIETENYEFASKIRDEINRRKQQQ